MNLAQLGKNIKVARTLKGWTQKELALKIGRTESSIRKYENGNVEAPNSVVEEIADVLEVGITKLLWKVYEEEKPERDVYIDEKQGDLDVKTFYELCNTISVLYKNRALINYEMSVWNGEFKLSIVDKNNNRACISGIFGGAVVGFEEVTNLISIVSGSVEKL